MTASRTSNKQILDAILGLTEAITASQTQNVAPTPPVLTPVVTPLGTVEAAPERVNDTPTVNVPKQYLAHMTGKVTGKAAEEGEAYMLYARKNLAGETKLAYCKAARWSALKDKGLIGPIELIEA